jgi:hypothetical protein
MTRIAPVYHWGSEVKNVNDVLYNQLQDCYSQISSAMNTRPVVIVKTLNPPADAQINGASNLGDIWVNSSTDTA